MTLKIRIIPTLLWDGISLVKGSKFNNWRRIGALLPALKVYNQRMVDELIVVDINATKDQRSPDWRWVEEFSSECFVPLTVGGGVRTLEDIQRLLWAGADKVCINSALFEQPSLLRESVGEFGSQCIVASIDVQRFTDGPVACYAKSGQIKVERDVVSWAKEVETRGAGEILLTSIDRDGTMSGYDVALVKKISESVKIPVIASGGAGTAEHIHEVICAGGASAVSAASMFHFTQQTPLEVKKYLQKKGILVRI